MDFFLRAGASEADEFIRAYHGRAVGKAEEVRGGGGVGKRVQGQGDEGVRA